MSETTSEPVEVPVELGVRAPEAPRDFEGRVVPITDEVSISVDGVTHPAQKGELLIDALERAGTYVPRFCYHPRMSSVGMCRMCLVEVDGPRGPSLQPSCMVPVGPDMVVNTKVPGVEKAQDGVLEFLLINHPLDCPVCDKGGECPLQDHTLAFGPGESRFREEKRHYEKPIAISDTVYLDRERCILCDRCTRFADEVAGDPLIHFTDRGNATQVQTFPGEPFASYFSGNVVQICPVGALTAKPYRFKARPWDLEHGESTCRTCSVGCQVRIDTSRNKILRIAGVDRESVNQGWLCDRGRFSFEAVNSEQRVTQPLIRRNGELVAAGWTEAFDAVVAALGGAGASASRSVGVIGGRNLTNESAYAWAKLVKGTWGIDDVDSDMGDGIDGDLVAALEPVTVDELGAGGRPILWLAGDPKEEAPVLFLRMRDAILRHRANVVEVRTPEPTSLAALAGHSLVARPGELGVVTAALLGSGDAHADTSVDASALSAARQALGTGPIDVVLGRRCAGEGSDVLAAVLSDLGATGREIRVLPLLRGGNARGAIDMGLFPGLLPGRTERSTDALGAAWATQPTSIGRSTREMLVAAAEGSLSTLVLLASDPLGEAIGATDAVDGLAKATVIAIDSYLTPSAALADVVLPMSAPGEEVGTVTNLEGRVTTVSQRVSAMGTARPAWQYAAELAARTGSNLGLSDVDQITDEIARVAAPYAAATAEGVRAMTEPRGVMTPGTAVALPTDRTASSPPVSGYSFRLVTSRKMYDRATDLALCPSSAHLALSASARFAPSDFAIFGVDAGTAVTLVSRLGKAVVPAVPDPSVERGHVHAVVGAPGSELHRLIDPAAPLCEVRVETGEGA